jgi:hypothetical protein
MWPFWFRFAAIVTDVVLWCVSFALWWNDQLLWAVLTSLASFIIGAFTWNDLKAAGNPIPYQRDDHFDA